MSARSSFSSETACDVGEYPNLDPQSALDIDPRKLRKQTEGRTPNPAMECTTAQRRSTNMAHPRVHIEHHPNPPLPADARVSAIMGIYSWDQGTKEWPEHYRTVCGTSGRTTVQREAEELIHVLVTNVESGRVASKRILRGDWNWVNIRCWYSILDLSACSRGIIFPKSARYLILYVVPVMLRLLCAFCSLNKQARRILVSIPPKHLTCLFTQSMHRTARHRRFSFFGFIPAST
jgi:hypothetical protein